MNWFELDLTDEQAQKIRHITQDVDWNIRNEHKVCVICQLEIPAKGNRLESPKLNGVVLSQQNAIEAKKGFDILAAAEHELRRGFPKNKKKEAK